MRVSQQGANELAAVLGAYETEILTEWLAQLAAGAREGRRSAPNLQAECREFLSLLARAAVAGYDFSTSEWDNVRDFLGRFSRTRGEAGFTPSETASFVLSLKKPIFTRLQRALAQDPERLGDEVWASTEVFDRLALFTIEAHQRSREELIKRQQQEMLELSTPVVKLWEGILAVPMIGTLDSGRTQVVMESLLQKIVDTESTVAIIDITGVPTVDTLVAQHLLKTVTAARLMGADCIVSGVRPQIAQTIVHLGVDLGNIVTKASLADAFAHALRVQGRRVVTSEAR